MGNTFLDREKIAILTGRKTKGHQIDALRRMGIPFFVNATGHPVLARAAIEGKPNTTPPKRTWAPRS
jgi:hypothetical protein